MSELLNDLCRRTVEHLTSTRCKPGPRELPLLRICLWERVWMLMDPHGRREAELLTLIETWEADQDAVLRMVSEGCPNAD